MLEPIRTFACFEMVVGTDAEAKADEDVMHG